MSVMTGVRCRAQHGPPFTASPAARRRRLVAAGLLRAFTAALVILLATTAWQLRRVLVSANPAIRAIEGVAATAPLFLLLFAVTYYALAGSRPGAFNVASLSRTDALYFTVTVFATVGFGDIVATSQSTRSLVTLQMILDLIVLGLGVRVFLGAIRLGRSRQSESGDKRQEE